jgi:hypothetical protein
MRTSKADVMAKLAAHRCHYMRFDLIKRVLRVRWVRAMTVKAMVYRQDTPVARVCPVTQTASIFDSEVYLSAVSDNG